MFFKNRGAVIGLALLVLIITAFLSLVANALSSNIPFLDAVPGMVILIAISLEGIIAARVLPGGIPAVA